MHPHGIHETVVGAGMHLASLEFYDVPEAGSNCQPSPYEGRGQLLAHCYRRQLVPIGRWRVNRQIDGYIISSPAIRRASSTHAYTEHSIKAVQSRYTAQLEQASLNYAQHHILRGSASSYVSLRQALSDFARHIGWPSNS